MLHAVLVENELLNSSNFRHRDGPSLHIAANEDAVAEETIHLLASKTGYDELSVLHLNIV